jgi:ribosome-binding factor A
MADSRRVERVAALIRREASEMLLHGVRDLRVVEGMVSITRVDVARDLQHCRIHVSVFGNEAERQSTLAGLRAAAPYVKGELGRRLKLRRTPEVTFSLDRGLEEGSNVLGLLERLEAERLDRAGHEPADPGSDADPAHGSAVELSAAAAANGQPFSQAGHGGSDSNPGPRPEER